MSDLVLTDDQMAAYKALIAFILHPTQTVFNLAGYAGTGKTTLINKVLDDLPAIFKTDKLITNKTDLLSKAWNKDWEVQLTATTNKAVQALDESSKLHRVLEKQLFACTIQSYLGLVVRRDIKTNKTKLVDKAAKIKRNKILFIDEASYIDSDLLEHIFKWTQDCKIIFVGDPAQLSPVKSSGTPVYQANFEGATLEQVVRQSEGNQIAELAEAFRNTVKTSVWPTSFSPDGINVMHLSQEDFEQEMLKEFTQQKKHNGITKVLAWTNARVISYNHAISNAIQGVPELQVGDYAVCNQYINTDTCHLKTDETVLITEIKPTYRLGVEGWHVRLKYGNHAFMPRRLEDRKALIKKLRESGKASPQLIEVETAWIDLRAAYACTINKSQGSTYSKVFIDINDIARCNQGSQIARMLYVAVSRAKDKVFLTGDFA